MMNFQVACRMALQPCASVPRRYHPSVCHSPASSSSSYPPSLTAATTAAPSWEAPGHVMRLAHHVDARSRAIAWRRQHTLRSSNLLGRW
eukprot:scaffold264482_cov33-Tisochrysis_lutea.AAC.4